MANQLIFANKVVFLGGLPLTLPSLSADPGPGTAGDLYYNTSSNTVRYYNGVAWTPIQGTTLTGFTLNENNIIVGDASNLSVAMDTSSLGDILADSITGMTVQKIQGTTVSGTTGSGNVVFSLSPTFTGTVNGGAVIWSSSNQAAAFVSGSSNPAATGVLKLASADAIVWRNNANSADIPLSKDTSDQLRYNFNPLFTSAGILISSAFPALTGDVATTAGSLTTTIQPNVVTYAKFQQVAASSLVGNPTGLLANAQGVTLGATLTFSGTALQTLAITGDVAASANSFATTIQPNVVTYAKFQQVAASSFVGNPTGVLANAQAITLGATLTFSGTALQTLALTSDVTSAANSFVTTVSKIQGTTVSGTTGSGNVVFGTGPSISGGTIATSSITAPTISGAGTITDAVTFVNASVATKVLALNLSGMTAARTLTLSSSQSTTQTLTIPNITGADVLVTQAFAQTLTNKTIATDGTNLIGATAISGATGSANVVFSTAPTFSTSITINGASAPITWANSGSLVNLASTSTPTISLAILDSSGNGLTIQPQTGLGTANIVQVKTSGGTTLFSVSGTGTTTANGSLTSTGQILSTFVGQGLKSSASNAASSQSVVANNTSAAAESNSQLLLQNNSVHNFRIQQASSGGISSTALTNGLTGEIVQLFTDFSGGMSIGTNNISAINIDTSQNVVLPSGDFTNSGNNARFSLFRSGGDNFFDWATGQSLKFSTETSAGGAGRSTKFILDTNGNIIVGTAAIATNATDGFFYLESCAGTPTGVPTSYTGRSPVVIDTSNNKFWFYNAGWQSVSAGGGAQAWPNQFASSEATLSAAITSCSSGGGGVICLTASFTITSSHTIPANTTLVGQMGNTIMTIGSGGAIVLATNANLQYLYVSTALSSGTLITASGSNSSVENCSFTVPGSSTTVCINVTGSNLLIFRNTFNGCAGPSTGVGIQFTSGTNNVSQYNIFSP